ncbi:MAG: creatininase family protein [Pseudomonadota bacterium]
MSLQGYWADQPSRMLKGAPADLIAVLPLGATEQHGPHLPCSVDTDLVTAFVSRALAALKPAQNVLFLPVLSVTKSGEHDAFPGTLSLSADTLLAVLRDIGASVARAGVTRLVLLNAHGGNTALLEVVARDLRIAHDLIVVTCSWFGFLEYGADFDPAKLPFDIHAGDTETSAMLAAYPGKVDMTRARDFVPKTADWARDNRFIGLTGQAARPAWVAGDLHAEGACGDASAATAEKGELLLSSGALAFAAFLAEFAAFDGRGEA